MNEMKDRVIGTGDLGDEARALMRVASALENPSGFSIPVAVAPAFFVGSDVSTAYFSDRTFPRDLELQLKKNLAKSVPGPLVVYPSYVSEGNYRVEPMYCADEDLLSSTMAAMYDRVSSFGGVRAVGLVVARVPGRAHGRRFFPEVSGVGLSINPYAWSEFIHPNDGAIRLVCGLGSRFDRADEDYSRLVSLGAPNRRPETDFEEIACQAQRRVDFIDLERKETGSDYFADLAREAGDLPLDLLSTEDEAVSPLTGERNRVLTLEGLVTGTGLVRDLVRLFDVLRETFGQPFEVQFELVFDPVRKWSLHISACRLSNPSLLAAAGAALRNSERVQRLIEARTALIGKSRVMRVDRFVCVEPSAYSRLPMQDRFEVARLIGRINRAPFTGHTVLIGPGRWGTTTPSLGVPASFAEINRMSVIVELALMHEHLSPEVSLATHFLNDLVAADLLYTAVTPDKPGEYFNAGLFGGWPNRLGRVVPDTGKWEPVLMVLDATDLAVDGRSVLLCADGFEGSLICAAGVIRH